MARDWREYLRQQEIKTVPIEDVKPYPNNPRDNSPAVPAVAASIERFGFRNPILVDGDGVIIEGHTRRLAAIKLGMREVPVVYATDLTPDEVKALRVIDNKTAELADWDEDVLAGEAELLKDAGFDLDDFGFDPKELEALLSPVPADGQTDADDVPDVDDSEPVRSKRGEVYVLGAHRLMCGDSTKAEDVTRLMSGGKARMVFTDPPWNVAYGETKKDNPQGYKVRTILNDKMTTDDFHAFMDSVFRRMAGASEKGCPTYVVMSAQEWGNLMLALKDGGYHWSSTVIWAKDRLVLSRKDYHTQYEPIWYGWLDGAPRLREVEDRKQSDLWEIPRPSRSEEHPTMKPVEALRGKTRRTQDDERDRGRDHRGDPERARRGVACRDGRDGQGYRADGQVGVPRVHGTLADEGRHGGCVALTRTAEEGERNNGHSNRRDERHRDDRVAPADFRPLGECRAARENAG